MSDGLGGVGLLQYLLENSECLLGTHGLDHVSGGPAGGVRGSERVGLDSSSVNLGGGVSTEDMSDPVEDAVSSLEEVVSRSEAVFGEAVSSHGREHP